MALPNVAKLLKKNPLGTFIGAMVILPVAMGFVWALSTGKPSQTTTKATSTTVSPTKKPEVPTLEIFESPVQVKMPKASGFIAAKNKQQVPEGTQIQTGDTGRAQVVFPAGTVTRIDNNGLIKISKASDGPENIMITILKGRVWSRIKKLLGNESYSTETSNLVATVRGTSYGHGLIEGGFDKGTVFKGKVKMTCKKTEDSMEVVPDKKAMVNCEKGLGMEMLDMEPKDKTDEWLLFNKAQDIIVEKRFGKETYADDDEVLGTETSVTPTKIPQRTVTRPPSPTPQPTSTTTNTNTTNGPSATPSPVPTTVVNTPIPTSTPIPTLPPAPTILSVSEGVAIAGTAVIPVTIIGTNLDFVTGVTLTDATGATISARSFSFSIARIGANILADFDGLSCTSYTLTVTSPGGSATSTLRILSIC